jgi:hypothetical protein|tara:strand:+ start:148 stop:477 length:330 start_codon:yes stop_codon:yes gene_type:complete
LLPNDVALSIKLLLTSNERYFLTSDDTIKPKFIVHDAFMYFQVVLLKDAAFHRLTAALNAGNHFETRFKNMFGKTYTVDKNRMEKTLDISLKDPFEKCIVILHKASKIT